MTVTPDQALALVLLGTSGNRSTIEKILGGSRFEFVYYSAKSVLSVAFLKKRSTTDDDPLKSLVADLRVRTNALYEASKRIADLQEALLPFAISTEGKADPLAVIVSHEQVQRVRQVLGFETQPDEFEQ